MAYDYFKAADLDTLLAEQLPSDPAELADFTRCFQEAVGVIMMAWASYPNPAAPTDARRLAEWAMANVCKIMRGKLVGEISRVRQIDDTDCAIDAPRGKPEEQG